MTGLQTGIPAASLIPLVFLPELALVELCIICICVRTESRSVILEKLRDTSSRAATLTTTPKLNRCCPRGQ